MAKKYKIVFDTNIIFNDREDELDKIFNSNLEKIFNFIKEHNIKGIKLGMPQLVFDERVAKRLFQIREQYERFNSVVKKMIPLGGINLKSKIFNEDRYKKLLNKNGMKIIKKYKIKIIPTVKIEQRILVKRALQKKVAFCGGRGDNGFKDTIIWLSLLEDTKKDNDHSYLFITNDTTNFKENLCKDEFKEHSKADFFLITGLNDLEKFLDEELNLDLQLEKTYHEIRQELLSLQGTITSEVGSYINSNSNILDSSWMTSHLSFSTPDDKSGTFDFLGLEINNIMQESENQFSISLKLSAMMKKKGSNLLTAVPYLSLESDGMVIYNVNLIYRRDVKNINIVSVAKEAIPYLRI